MVGCNTSNCLLNSADGMAGHLKTMYKAQNSHQFQSLHDYAGSETHKTTYSAICNDTSQLPTQCAIIAAINEDPPWETEEIPSLASHTLKE